MYCCAISSLTLKLLDWVIIIFFGNCLKLNDLQFKYQPGIFENMCTWAVLETVDYFLRNGSEVFMCTMDMSLSAIFLGLLIFIYTEPFANGRWNRNGEISSVFPMHNGVRQGAVLSALAYCFYCEELFSKY